MAVSIVVLANKNVLGDLKFLRVFLNRLLTTRRVFQDSIERCV